MLFDLDGQVSQFNMHDFDFLFVLFGIRYQFLEISHRLVSCLFAIAFLQRGLECAFFLITEAAYQFEIAIVAVFVETSKLFIFIKGHFVAEVLVGLLLVLGRQIAQFALKVELNFPRVLDLLFELE